MSSSYNFYYAIVYDKQHKLSILTIEYYIYKRTLWCIQVSYGFMAGKTSLEYKLKHPQYSYSLVRTRCIVGTSGWVSVGDPED